MKSCWPIPYRPCCESKGFEVEAVYDGETGEEYAESGVYDLLILDVMMPKMDGYQVARQVRARRLRDAHSDADGQIRRSRTGSTGLNAGADYYLTKPFDTRELLACIGALLRRQGTEVNELSFGNTALDLASCTLLCRDKQIRLSAREFDVMRYLLQIEGAERVQGGHSGAKVWGFDSERGGKPCGGLCGLFAQEAQKHRLQRAHRVGAPAGVPSGGGGG